MATMFDPMGRARSRSWKLTATGIAALLVVGVGVLGYVAWTATHQSSGAAPAAEMTPTAAHPAIRMGTVSGAATAPVEAPLVITSADGVGSTGISLTYDPAVVSVLALRNGNVPQSQLTWRHDAAQGTIVMLLTTALPAGAMGEHVLAYVTLEAVDGAVGKVSPLALSVRSAFLATGESVTLSATSGSFHNGMPGDVTGNGVVDSDDYARLADYLVGEPVSIIALNADLDGDGKVTDADAIKLHQFLTAQN